MRELEAARAWDLFAAEKEQMAVYQESRKEPSEPSRNLARLARSAAASLRLKAETGVEHCCCHLAPINTCLSSPQARR
jgi:hypothetical protein